MLCAAKVTARKARVVFISFVIDLEDRFEEGDPKLSGRGILKAKEGGASYFKGSKGRTTFS